MSDLFFTSTLVDGFSVQVRLELLVKLSDALGEGRDFGTAVVKRLGRQRLRASQPFRQLFDRRRRPLVRT